MSSDIVVMIPADIQVSWWAIALGIGGVAALAIHVVRRRRGELAHLAAETKLVYSPTDPIGVPGRYYHLRLMNEGHDRRAWNVIHGPSDLGRIAAFCYQHEVGRGSRRRAAAWTVVVLETPGRRLPVLIRRREAGHTRRIGESQTLISQPLSADQPDGLHVFSERRRQAAINGKVSRWLQEQPSDLTWEMSYGLLAVYSPLSQPLTQIQELIPLVRQFYDVLAQSDPGYSAVGE